MANVVYFSGNLFEMSENVATAVDSLHPDTIRLIDGEYEPTDEGAATWGRAK